MRSQKLFSARLLLSTSIIASLFYAPNAFAQSADEEGLEQDINQENEPENDEEDIDISIPGGGFEDEIVVRGKFIPDPIRATPQVVSVLGAEEIARTAEGDIAGSLKRVTGLSVVGSGFVFVRGLGERYSLALLNGSPLPSPEPLRRVVPLDLFPSSVISSAIVQKSYSANFPGEFGGGVINLTTKSAPEESFLTLNAGISGDTFTTNNLGFVTEGSSTDFLGFDNGLRSIPDGLQNAINLNVPISVGPNFNTLDLQNFAASLTNAETSLVQQNNNIPANFSLGLDAGTSFDVGNALIGVIATAGWNNSFRTRGGVQQTSQGIVQVDGQDGLLPDTNFDFVTTENRIIVNGLLGLSAEFGKQKIRFTNLYIRDTIKDANIRQGIDAISVDEETLLNQSRTGFFARQLFSTQLVGEFQFNDFNLDVRGSYANSRRDAPYERTFSFAFDRIIANDFVNDLTSPGESAEIRFSDLSDNVYSFSIDAGYRLPTSIPLKFSTGYNYYLNDRTASRRDFRFTPINGIQSPIDQQRPDFLLSDFNTFGQGIELREVASAISVPTYTAELEVHAAYGQIDFEPIDAVQINLGLRYEDAIETVSPITLEGSGSFAVPTNLSNDYFLPSATITWNFADDLQFRLAASRTIARPQFRELAPQQFLDLETDRTFVGNPLLQDSELFNAEGRFEYYFGRGERFTAAAFYKQIDNPIETVAFVQGGGTLFTGFSNAPSAQLYGAEVEAVKFIPLSNVGGAFFENRRLLLVANYTYTNSSISVNEGDTSISPITFTQTAASNLFDDGDALTGQSDHLVNLQFGLESETKLSQQTLLLTYNSDRVSARGPQSQPDLIEDTGVRLDFVMREEINIFRKTIEMKLEVRNILGTDFVESQTLGATQILNNSFEIGTGFSFGISAKF